MPVVKFDETPYHKVREGLQRKIVHTGDLKTVLLDFSHKQTAVLILLKAYL